MAKSHAALTMRVEASETGSIAISAIVHAELCFGLPVLGDIGKVILERFVQTFAVMPFDHAASEAVMHVPFKRGRLDRLIAAHALSLEATLVTNNENDFSDVPSLKLENWSHG